MTSAYVLGVDTNVLVRFLADDDDVQSPIARNALTNQDNHPIYINLVVFAETYTILTRIKKFPSDRVRDAMELLLNSSDFIVERPDLAAAALDHGALAKCGAVDALIGIVNAAAKCETTLTFDVRAQRLETMIAVEERI